MSVRPDARRSLRQHRLRQVAPPVRAERRSGHQKLEWGGTARRRGPARVSLAIGLDVSPRDPVDRPCRAAPPLRCEGGRLRPAPPSARISTALRTRLSTSCIVRPANKPSRQADSAQSGNQFATGRNPSITVSSAPRRSCVAALRASTASRRPAGAYPSGLSTSTWVPQLTCDLVHDDGCWCRSARCDLVQYAESPSNTTWPDVVF